jgi:exodeoxyribonuclease-3
MQITTWNVNSIRTRLDRVLSWIEANEPDVLALQEIKVQDADFPRERFEALGYHVETSGQKTYNGVALISREPLTDVVRTLPDDPDTPEARILAATTAGVRVIDVYVPNGKHIASDKFAYKLDWLDRLHEALRTQHEPTDPLLLLGDFNIAPEARDVHDPDAWAGRVHFHPVEHAMLSRFLDWGLTDLLRARHDEPGIYSWWDYRGGALQQDKGLRIDLILGTAPMAARLEDVVIDRDERRETADAGKPSDHAPVTASFAPA